MANRTFASRIGLIAVSFAAAAALLISAGTADAKCTRLASSVNDYGKIGPANDAKTLLDKQIADNMAKRGVAKYSVGKKDVTCELFLDFGVFDEYTCKAAATVCWGGETASGAVEAKAKTGEPIATGSVKKEPITAKKKPAAAAPAEGTGTAPLQATPPVAKKDPA